MKEFIEPQNMEEALNRKAELVENIQRIDLQLSDKCRIDPDTHKRLDDRAFHQWRRAALQAKLGFTNELRKVKAAMRVFTPPERSSNLELLRRAHALLCQLRSTTDLTAEESAEIDAIGEFL